MNAPTVPLPAGLCRRHAFAALGLGLGLTALAFAALASIPRGLHEFVYYSFPSYDATLEPLPFAPMNGFTPEQLSSHLARLVLLAPGCILVGVGIAPLLAGRKTRPSFSWRPIALTSCLLVATAAAWVFRGTPVQDDEPTYLMQASALAEGRLFDPPVPIGNRWSENFTVFTGSGTTGKYLFGTPFVLSLGLRLEVPLLPHVLLVFATLYFMFKAAHAAGATLTATIGVALLAVSPQFVFTSATPTSQAPALAAIAVAVWAAGRGGDFSGFIAGSALGAAFTCRPQMAVPCGLAIILPALWRDRRFVLATIMAGVPWLLMVLLYDAALTAHALRLPWDAFSVERYGFGWWSLRETGYYFHPVKAVLNVGSVLIRLNGWGLGWPLSLAGPVAWFAFGRPARAAVAPWAWIAVATFAFQFAYYSVGTSETGAIYHHAVLPFIALSTAAVLEHLGSGRYRYLAAGVAVSCAALGTGSFLVEHAARLRRLAEFISEPVRVAKAEAQIPALVFLEPHFAGRLPVGWVFGPPERLRGPYEPIVIYPAGREKASDALRESMSHRQCYYEYYDYAQARYVLTSCTKMKRLHEGFLEDSTLLRYPHPESADGRFPRWIEGGWRSAFRWVPLLSR
ncbi:hypothetical protein [Anaeromyxobacter oryzisoli]|uniref:hypothetical protein n=1 Tax=Anaeromyxobacter oryzisoli TaxID=2925408 RepID=UPI001F58969F|nr:hypothetical protein [Anaeromyxobacter sp. SG63]